MPAKFAGLILAILFYHSTFKAEICKFPWPPLYNVVPPSLSVL